MLIFTYIVSNDDISGLAKYFLLHMKSGGVKRGSWTLTQASGKTTTTSSKNGYSEDYLSATINDTALLPQQIQ